MTESTDLPGPPECPIDHRLMRRSPCRREELPKSPGGRWTLKQRSLHVRPLGGHKPADLIADDDGFSVAENLVWQAGLDKVVHDLLDGFALRLSGTGVRGEAEVNEPEPVPDGRATALTSSTSSRPRRVRPATEAPALQPGRAESLEVVDGVGHHSDASARSDQGARHETRSQPRS